jgi:hypothetical protein
MSQIDPSIPVDDPDQLVIAPVSDEKRYLGNASVVHEFVGSFASEVIKAYDGFLSARIVGFESQRQINALIKEYADAFMGRDPRYQIAPWQGVKLRVKICQVIPKATVLQDCGECLFKHIAHLCVKCAIGLAKGWPEDEVGENLKEILDYHRGLILGLDV